MRRCQSLFSATLTLVCVGSLLTTLMWYTNSDVEMQARWPEGESGGITPDKCSDGEQCGRELLTLQKTSVPTTPSVCQDCGDGTTPGTTPPPFTPGLCTKCGENIKKLAKGLSMTWRKQEESTLSMRCGLAGCCDGTSKAFLTQANTPLGSKLLYDGDNKSTKEVTHEILGLMAKVGDPGTWSSV